MAVLMICLNQRHQHREDVAHAVKKTKLSAHLYAFALLVVICATDRLLARLGLACHGLAMQVNLLIMSARWCMQRRICSMQLAKGGHRLHTSWCLQIAPLKGDFR